LFGPVNFDKPFGRNSTWKSGDKNNIKAIHKFTTPMPYEGQVLNVVKTVREFYRKESFGGLTNSIRSSPWN
jgi:hypothetical protein